jgi:hypothetical protein
MTDKSTRDDVLRRVLKTPSMHLQLTGKREKTAGSDPMPTDDPESLIEWGERNVQGN